VPLVDKATDTTDLNTTETDTALEENIPTDTATEVDVQSVHSGVSEESSGPSIEPSSSDESDENPDKTDCNLVERTILIEGKPPQDQMKFVVFEEAILHVFGKCYQCGSKTTITVESQIGSCCKICSSCTVENTHYYEWTTGPLTNKMPTFHLLLASGILATGMETSKVLRLFDCLKIPNVKQRELSNIFKNYVIPGIYSVWRTEQNARMKEIEGEQIVVASDMRVDSPGHSGLFGSGSTLDMGRNIILDTQVIKV
jgi:solute carrier family 8 (sodium/calcium exchanger)